MITTTFVHLLHLFIVKFVYCWPTSAISSEEPASSPPPHGSVYKYHATCRYLRLRQYMDKLRSLHSSRYSAHPTGAIQLRTSEVRPSRSDGAPCIYAIKSTPNMLLISQFWIQIQTARSSKIKYNS